MMIAQAFIEAGAPKKSVLAIVGLSRSTYYYHPREGKRGRAPSTHTRHASGALISNIVVVEGICWLLCQEFVDYGYVKATH